MFVLYCTKHDQTPKYVLVDVKLPERKILYVIRVKVRLQSEDRGKLQMLAREYHISNSPNTVQIRVVLFVLFIHKSISTMSEE